MTASIRPLFQLTASSIWWWCGLSYGSPVSAATWSLWYTTTHPKGPQETILRPFFCILHPSRINMQTPKPWPCLFLTSPLHQCTPLAPWPQARLKKWLCLHAPFGCGGGLLFVPGEILPHCDDY